MSDSRFGITGGNIIASGPAVSTPERIAERRAFAEYLLSEHKRVGAGIVVEGKPFAHRVHTRFKKSLRRKAWRRLRYWQSCVDRMKNGDIGMPAEWALQWKETFDNFQKSCEAFRNFRDADGEKIAEIPSARDGEAVIQ